jgi:hypothetical protein
MRNARASDTHKLKGITSALLFMPELAIRLAQNTRVDHRFKNNDTGCMLIPAEYIEAYNDNPIW